VGLGSAKAATIQTQYVWVVDLTRPGRRQDLIFLSLQRQIARDHDATDHALRKAASSRVGGPDMPRASGGSRRWRHGAHPRPGRGRPRARVLLSRRNARTASTSSFDSATQTRRRVLYRREVRIPPLWVTRADRKFVRIKSY
jgi:hypothetical protein